MPVVSRMSRRETDCQSICPLGQYWEDFGETWKKSALWIQRMREVLPWGSGVSSYVLSYVITAEGQDERKPSVRNEEM